MILFVFCRRHPPGFHIQSRGFSLVVVATMKTPSRRILVTSALPYANGSLHLGHMLEYIQTDIWVRLQRLSGNTCFYVCADDAHGTPIMLKAREAKISPESLIAKYSTEHQLDFSDFQISFDHYHSTHSEENRKFSTEIYQRLEQAGHIFAREITQAYDEKAQVFLPDRYVHGTCPFCDSPDQYGDSCEGCGATYDAKELKSPRSALSGLPPVYRRSKHLFFRLSDFSGQLRAWLLQADVQDSVRNKLEEWFDDGLKDWDISRDAPYFGFKIPGQRNKYFYVWLDAPIGYMAAFQAFCAAQSGEGRPVFADYWEAGEKNNTELHHFIGKDIAYFHTLFWPATLMGSGFRTPSAVHCHGFLTVNGKKMSKSRGTFITARCYLRHIKDAEYLRYYFACKINSGIGDIDLSLDDFVKRVNSDLVGKLVNIASRCARYVAERCDDEIVFVHWQAMHKQIHDLCFTSVSGADALAPGIRGGEEGFIVEMERLQESVLAAYESLEYSRAMRDIMGFADQVNRWLDAWKPWRWPEKPQIPGKMGDEALRPYKNLWQYVCGHAMVLFAFLMSLLHPVLPKLCERAEKYLQMRFVLTKPLRSQAGKYKVGKFVPLMRRIEKKTIATMLAESTVKEKGSMPEEKASDDRKTVSIDDFAKLDMRVAKVLRAEEVPGADRLLKLTLDVGGSEPETVFSGIKKHYSVTELEGRLVVYLANLEPKKMRFGVSKGMVLAAGADKVFLLGIDTGAQPGTRIS